PARNRAGVERAPAATRTLQSTAPARAGGHSGRSTDRAGPAPAPPGLRPAWRFRCAWRPRPSRASSRVEAPARVHLRPLPRAAPLWAAPLWAGLRPFGCAFDSSRSECDVDNETLFRLYL